MRDSMVLLARRPTHPGEILREDFMMDYGLSVAQLSAMLGVSRQTVNDVVRCRRAVSPEMALRLSRVFSTTPQFWLNLQRNVDLWDSFEVLEPSLKRVKPLVEAVASGLSTAAATM
ncbi:MAG: HigA family addiction module antidote protein [Eggerthellaceae bacterium]|nr:HigA family addiction module antidote protein [Eggerthellaceae bacterium]